MADIDYLNIPDDLRRKIKAALSAQVSIDHLKSRINIPILLLHECAQTAKCKDLSETYKDAMILYHTERAGVYFQKQILSSSTVHMYDKIKFHIILFPVPSKKIIVDAFTNIATLYKGRNNGDI